MFSIIEGSVDTKSTTVKTSGQINIASGDLGQIDLNFVSAATLTKILVSSDAAASFDIELYSHSPTTSEYFVMSAISDGDQKIHSTDNLSIISPESKLYLKILNHDVIMHVFDIVIHGEITRAKII